MFQNTRNCSPICTGRRKNGIGGVFAGNQERASFPSSCTASLILVSMPTLSAGATSGILAREFRDWMLHTQIHSCELCSTPGCLLERRRNRVVHLQNWRASQEKNKFLFSPRLLSPSHYTLEGFATPRSPTTRRCCAHIQPRKVQANPERNRHIQHSTSLVRRTCMFSFPTCNGAPYGGWMDV